MIERRDGVCGGRPVISGTSVSVQRIVGWKQQGLSAEEIAEEYWHLTQGQVYAALDYYDAHREEIDGYLAQETQEALDFQDGAACEGNWKSHFGEESPK